MIKDILDPLGLLESLEGVVEFYENSPRWNGPIREDLQGMAFWAKWDMGKVMMLNVIDGKHIDFIIRNPEQFGITSQIIQRVFDKNGEKLGQEGKAREELIKFVAKEGWIRIRHYVGKNDYWSVQTDSTQKRRRELLMFFKWAFEEKVIHPDDNLILMGYDDPNDVHRFMTVEGGARKVIGGF